MQLAKLAGNKVIATCGGKDKAELLKDLGVDRVIDYKAEDIKTVSPLNFFSSVEIYDAYVAKWSDTGPKFSPDSWSFPLLVGLDQGIEYEKENMWEKTWKDVYIIYILNNFTRFPGCSSEFGIFALVFAALFWSLPFLRWHLCRYSIVRKNFRSCHTVLNAVKFSLTAFRIFCAQAFSRGSLTRENICLPNILLKFLIAVIKLMLNNNIIYHSI